MGAAIAVKGLRKAYREHRVLLSVDLEVDSGTIFALLGSNGAGKTTIINILTTLLPADGGSAVVGGFDVRESPREVREHISLTGQFAAVDDVLTARENLELIGALRHVHDSTQTALDLVTKFGLDDAADRRVATFSGGMRRRLDIAMSLIGNPDIIFLDEPTNGLDPSSRNDMWQTIRILAQSGTTVFLTTQYLEEADELADVIAVLHEGRIIARGTAVELKRLVPGAMLKFTFDDAGTLETAVELLTREYEITDRDGLTFTIATGGGATQIADVFIRLRDASLTPSDFAQQLPTLDDVFFKLTSSEGRAG